MALSLNAAKKKTLSCCVLKKVLGDTCGNPFLYCGNQYLYSGNQLLYSVGITFCTVGTNFCTPWELISAICGDQFMSVGINSCGNQFLCCGNQFLDCGNGLLFLCMFFAGSLRGVVVLTVGWGEGGVQGPQPALGWSSVADQGATYFPSILPLA